jgi:hypothetical protein
MDSIVNVDDQLWLAGLRDHKVKYNARQYSREMLRVWVAVLK